MQRAWILGGVMVVWGQVAMSQAALRYVSPSGTGSTCSSSSPCSLNQGLSLGQPGDEIILKSGVYPQSLSTVRSGTSGRPIVIRAENRHQAIIRAATFSLVNIDHDYITIRQIQADGLRGSTRGSALLHIQGNTANPTVNNIIVEDSWFHDGGGVGMGVANASNIVIRHNIFEALGYGTNSVGEGMYLGSPVSLKPVTNMQVYGNTFRDTIGNVVDYKQGVTNVDVHHNVFENHVHTSVHGNGQEPNDGVVRTNGSNSTAGNYFQHNIVRNSTAVFGVIFISGNRVDVRNSVFYKITGGTTFVYRGGASSIISNNTACATPTANNAGTYTFTGNNMQRPQPECDAEANRIFAERAQLPGVGSGQPPPAPPVVTFASARTVDTTHIEMTFTAPADVTALSGCTAGSFSTTIGAGAAVVASAVSVSGLVATLTVQTMASGDVVRVSGTAGACTNAAVFDARAVTNTISPVAVEYDTATTLSDTTVEVTMNGPSGGVLSGCTAGSFSIRKNNGSAQAATAISLEGLVAILTVPQMAYSDVVTISGTSGACTGPTSSGAFTDQPVANTLTRPPDVINYVSATTVDATHVDAHFTGPISASLQSCVAGNFSTTISGGSATDAPTTNVLDNCNRTENPLANTTWASPFVGNHPGLQANGTACLGTQGTSFSSSYWLGAVGPDSEAYFTVSDATGTSNHFVAAHIRSREPGNTVDGYRVKVLESAAGTDTVELNRLTNLSTTVLASTALEISDGHKVAIRGLNSGTACTLSAKHYNGTTWSQVLSHTEDPCTYPDAGFIGVSATGNTLTVDDFGGGTTTGQTSGGGVATAVVVTGMTARITVPTMAAGQTITVTGIQNACTNTPAFTAQPVTNTLGGSNAVLTATHHRCFQIDSAEGGRPHTPVDTNCAWIPGAKGRLEFQVAASSANLPATQIDVECDDDGAEAWYRVGAGSGRVTYAFDVGVSDAVPAAPLVADCTYQATGLYYQLGQSPPLTPITLDNAKCTKIGASLQLNSGSVGQYSRCRLTGVGGAVARIDLVEARGSR